MFYGQKAERIHRRTMGGGCHQVVVAVLLVVVMAAVTEGHGRVWEPPQRATMWRRGFDTTRDYNDNSLYCGGFKQQWSVNGGKCGVCGDAYDLPSPRPHEAGGLYSTGVISRTYTQADVINVTVDITANHMGYFTFKLCPNNNFEKEATQTCLDSFVLQVVDASGQVSGERHYIDNTVGFKHVRLQLPEDVTCTQCVLQWTYNTGNSWGCGDNGCCIGCGPQEQFVNCVDIAITARDNSGSNIHTTTDSTLTQAASTVTQATSTATNTKTSRKYSRRTVSRTPTTSAATSTSPDTSTGCRGAWEWADDDIMREWCSDNCRQGYCPPSHCICN